MVRRELSQLAVYSINQEMETLPLECLRTLYLNKPSETVYIVKDKKLYGIVSMGEVLYGRRGNSIVRINKSFTMLDGYEVIKAYRIFLERPQIQKLPVVNEAGELLGDYSRWDDALYIERNQERLMQKEMVEKILKQYETVYIVEPVEKENLQYLRLMKYLDCFQIQYVLLGNDRIYEKLQEHAIFIFLNEDERRGMQCLYGLAPRPYDRRGYNLFQYDYLIEKKWKVRFATYKSLLIQIMKEIQLKELNIKKPEDLPYDRLDDKATVLLRALSSNGISSFYFTNDERNETSYGKSFKENMYKWLKEHPGYSRVWTGTLDKEAFYGELLQSEDYKKGIAQREIAYMDARLGVIKDIAGQYYNIKNGRRVTCYQPIEYIGTIYIVGLCIISGAYVEDQYTIASCLQKKLLERGYPYRVENYGTEMQFDVENRLEKIGNYSVNDLVIYHSLIGEPVDVRGISLEKIYENYDMPSDWVIDTYSHCNHKADQLIADSLLEIIEPSLLIKGKLEKNDEKLRINFSEIMKTYVRQKFLNQAFGYFDYRKYHSIGAIVMKGNFFNIAHRYLIETAKQQVEFLIVFVLEDNTFLQPFEERFKLIEEGTKDLDNVMIVPNGDFILSRNTFPEFYSKLWDSRTSVNAEYDSNVFADYIAKPLHITHRFAGVEPKEKIETVYHETMKRVLQEKGISFIEIPPMLLDGEVISTLLVQKYLECKEYDKAFSLVPESTKEYLMVQFNLTEDGIRK